MNFNTKLLHGNFSCDEKTGATTTPIYQSTAFRHQTAEDLENIFAGSQPGFVYTRLGNPSIDSFERRISLLEDGAGAVACASGMAAVTLAVLNIVKSGEEIVAGSGIFGGTYSLFKGLEEFGVVTRCASANTAAAFAACINAKTRLIFVETIGNPKLDVADLRLLSDLAHKNNIPLLVDNTVTTPYLIQPLQWGADIVIHSTSKYLNGSGNSIGGIIIDGGRFPWGNGKFPSFNDFRKYGKFAYLAKLRKGLFKDFGPCLSPFNAFLTATGMETLGLRMERLCDSAGKLAAALAQSRQVVSVNYPGLPDNSFHEVAKRQFGGRYGAILTIRVGSKANAFQVINSLKYALNLANIGDARTLVIHPASTIYSVNSLEEKEQAGVYEDLIRISVGLEDVEDLIEDFTQALAKLA
jgi:O-acetylhomoserine (thiol)-lyase